MAPATRPPRGVCSACARRHRRVRGPPSAYTSLSPWPSVPVSRRGAACRPRERLGPLRHVAASLPVAARSCGLRAPRAVRVGRISSWRARAAAPTQPPSPSGPARTLPSPHLLGRAGGHWTLTLGPRSVALPAPSQCWAGGAARTLNGSLGSDPGSRRLGSGPLVPVVGAGLPDSRCRAANRIRPLSAPRRLRPAGETLCSGQEAFLVSAGRSLRSDAGAGQSSALHTPHARAYKNEPTCPAEQFSSLRLCGSTFSQTLEILWCR